MGSTRPTKAIRRQAKAADPISKRVQRDMQDIDELICALRRIFPKSKTTLLHPHPRRQISYTLTNYRGGTVLKRKSAEKPPVKFSAGDQHQLEAMLVLQQDILNGTLLDSLQPLSKALEKASLIRSRSFRHLLEALKAVCVRGEPSTIP